MERQKKDQRSDLMKAQAMVQQGEKVNFCPFGCENEDIDEHGYCKHLVGFTNDRKFYEPMVYDVQLGRRIVRVRTKPGKDGKPVPELEPCQKGDRFVQISISSRVYRNTEAVPELEKPAKAK